jgi:hypothetical protein
LIGGGGVSGPGSSTSDSIPAMLSDGEYVVKASSAQKLGRGFLDWLNAGRFAGGGRVARLAGGGLSSEWFDPDLTDERSLELLAETVLSPQQLQLYRINQSKSPDESIKRINRFVLGHADGGAIGHLASGGMIDWPGLPGFGAPISGMGLSDAPMLSESAAPGSALGHYDVDLRTNHGDFRMMTSEETARQMTAAARDTALAQNGQTPSWYR